eukprot:15342059-Ditylum_brightwellii.AAC.1
MSTNIAIFHFLKDIVKGKEGRIVFDFGADQGFYIYFMTTFGINVRSFEIDEKNFKALRHGTEFNPIEVSERVNLYSVGIGQTDGQFSMKGSDYDGFLKKGSKRNILGVTFDCFAYCMQGKLNLSAIEFVKLGVEGFEITVLKGAHNSLLKNGHSNIGGTIMGVGLDNWNQT